MSPALASWLARPARARLLRLAGAASAAAWLALALVPAPARADELEDLRRENALLKDEVESLRSELADLRAGDTAGAHGDAGARSAPGPGGTRSEPIFVPRTRVTLEVADEPGGATALSTQWYRTSESGPLPRKEWFQLRARQIAGGALAGTWMLVDRQGGGPSARVEAGRFSVDGRVLDVPAIDYDVSNAQRSIGPIQSGQRRELIRFALPPEALRLLAGATRARFDAGPIAFELTDEQLAAFAAVAAKTKPAVATPPQS
jgi:hypothetical protein